MPLATRPSQQGVALIVTLILLAVTLVMAIAFLALSRRERASASTETQYITAKYAADAALNHAEAQIVSQILGATNPYISGLLVSTNYINGLGFTSGSANPTNVNYDHYLNSAAPLNQADFQQNIANLFYYPRPPVVYGSSSNTDSRFYLDLNRNGRYDTNGWVTNFDNNLNGLGYTWQVGDPEWIGILEHPDAPHGPNNPFIARYCFIAVPANSLDANYIHNQTFEATLGTTPPLGTPVNPPSAAEGDGYWRNQGVGTWEMNLAAFLADLNTNRWDPPTIWNSLLEPYRYPAGAYGNSIAFDDARALVAWRYTNYYALASADTLFGLGGYNAFLTNGIDDYGLASQTTFDTNYYPFYNANNAPNLPWVGAGNYNNFFSFPSDLFNTNKAYYKSGGNLQNGYSQFATNLYIAGTYNSTYDRYTYYRLLGQLGTDTSPASGKINLNYSNAIVNYDPIATNFATSITIVPNAETSFVPWRPKDFFTVAANQMLHAYTAAWYEFSPSNYIQTYYGVNDDPYYLNLAGVGVTNIQYYSQTNQIPAFGITNIPVLINGQFVYTPAVNRILQLAANIYDASTNTVNFALGMSNYPSVFRPIFWVTNESLNGVSRQIDVYVKGYEYVTEPLTGEPIFTPPIEVNDPYIVNLALASGGGIVTSNIWGVPWIVGAKKGLPNFNGLEVDSTFMVQRALQFKRQNSTPLPGDTYAQIVTARQITTNQMYYMGVVNTYGMEDWNSYANNYMNQVGIVAQENFGFALSNLDNVTAPQAQVNNMNSTNTYPLPNGYYTASSPGNPWPGYLSSSTTSFILPLGTNVVLQNLGRTSANIPSSSTNGVYIYFAGTSIGSTTVNGITYTAPCWIPTSANPANYLDQGLPPFPHLVMQTTNRVQAYMLDYGPNGSSAPYILDYVQLGGMNSSMDVNQAIANYDSDGLFSTNLDSDGTPYGINQQYFISDGTYLAPKYAPWTTSTDPSYNQEVADFQAFFSPDDSGSSSSGGTTYSVANFTNLVIQAPYSATMAIVQKFVYQANDPLVHYLTQDLNDFADITTNYIAVQSIQNAFEAFQAVTETNATFQNLDKTSDRYMPWGKVGNFQSATLNNYTPDLNPFNLSYKDPLVWTSDNWDFPSYKYPTVGWLGRVHRGTPWQTVFLKSTNIIGLFAGVGPQPTGLTTWQLFTGDVFNSDDAYNAAPIWDHLLFDLFTATPDDDATRGQVSVNIGANTPTSDPNYVLSGLASLSALLSGTLTFSNNIKDGQFNVNGYEEAQNPVNIGVITERPPFYSIWTNQPMGAPPYPGPTVNGITNSPMYQIVQGINATRATFTNLDGLSGIFEHVGDILSTPQLSDASPFLDLDSVQQQSGISDEMYEWMPQQLLGLMTVSGTPQAPTRYVVYCYGQTLKPAPNGVVLSGQFVGMCTNYQVTAETAARAVIRVVNPPSPENPNANPGIVVEQFNPLPPD